MWEVPSSLSASIKGNRIKKKVNLPQDQSGQSSIGLHDGERRKNDLKKRRRKREIKRKAVISG